ncbi:hypothetical protein [Agrobacterium vaccinii]|uniref:hypothetical protein n=1 Tax=Agrobacterium vaccinii TaxID=2735528 RepID=UPI003BAFBF2F
MELAQEFAATENAAFSNLDRAKKPKGIKELNSYGCVVAGVVVYSMSSRTWAARVSTAKGFVSTAIPGSSFPSRTAAFSA